MSNQQATSYDLVVIGDGLAARVAACEGALRRRVALVTAHDRPFSICAANWALRQSFREAARAVHQGATRGPALDYLGLLNEARRRLAQLTEPWLLENLAGLGVDVYRGSATFSRRQSLQIGRHTVTFHHAILAIEPRPAPLEIKGAASTGYLTDEGLFALAAVPERLTVLGLGPWECQWAQTFCRLGSQVHLVGRASRILPSVPAAVAMVVQRQLEQDGIGLWLDCRVLAIERTGTQRTVVLERNGAKEELFADQILVRPPFRTDLASFQLDAAGVAIAENRLVIDPWGRTTNHRVFAIDGNWGHDWDCPEIADSRARQCVSNALAWWPRRLDRRIEARYVWTDPEVVCLERPNVPFAGSEGIVDTYSVNLAEARQTPPERVSEAEFAQVSVRRATGQIVGAWLVAQEASDLAPLLLLLTAHNLPLSSLSGITPCHPGSFTLLQLAADRSRQGLPPSRWLLIREACQRWWQRWLQK